MKAMTTNRHLVDALRLVVIAAVATGALLLSKSSVLPDEMLAPLLASSAMIIYIAAFAHFVRRVLFPAVDLRTYLGIVEESRNPVASAIVFAAVAYLIGVLFQVFTAMLR